MTSNDPNSSSASGARSTNLARHLPAVILVIIVVGFAIDNRRNVTVGFVFTNARVPLVLVLVATAIIGALIGALLRRRRS